jgi:hypothetical protein
VVPHVLAQSDLVTVMPGRLASAITGNSLVARELPFASEPFDWMLYRHGRRDRSDAIFWQRDTLSRVTRALGPADSCGKS